MPSGADNSDITDGFNDPNISVRAAALENSVQRYSSGLFGMLFEQFGKQLDKHEILALVNQTFHELWKPLERGPLSVRSLWGLLSTTAHRRALDQLRKRNTWDARHSTTTFQLTLTLMVRTLGKGSRRTKCRRHYASFGADFPDSSAASATSTSGNLDSHIRAAYHLRRKSWSICTSVAFRPPKTPLKRQFASCS
jgi:hypothetical protein